jgi:hypothetical protein
MYLRICLEVNMSIDELQLQPVAAKAAAVLKQKHPNLEFTSGRRTIVQQAHAMARNIVELHDRQWIAKTYIAGAKLQHWVDTHPHADTVEELTAGLEQTMNAMSEAEVLSISRHLTGNAFDIRPVAQNSAAIVADIENLPGLVKFLQKEGGFVRWHVQF